MDKRGSSVVVAGGVFRTTDSRILLQFHTFLTTIASNIRSIFCWYNNNVYSAFPQSIHLALDEVGRGSGCQRDRVSVRKGSASSDTFGRIQYASKRLTNWTPTFGPGPKNSQRLQSSIAEKGHQPSNVPQ